MLNDTIEPIEFSVDFMDELEDLTLGDNDDITEDEIKTLIKKVIDDRKLYVGERSTGTIVIENGNIVFDYQYCSEVGEDWNDDEWNDEKFTIPNN